MSVHRSAWSLLLRLGALAFVAAGFILLPNPAGAYNFNAPIFKWDANSAQSGIWNNGTQTLTWHFNHHDFPPIAWATVAQTGAAFEHAYKTIQDTVGTSLKIVRGPDTTSNPMSGDNRLDMFFTYDENSSIFGGSIIGNFAVTHWAFNGTSLTDADIEMNGDPLRFGPPSLDWGTTGPPAPPNSFDVETTACHEQLHSIGVGHPIYFYSMVWPVGRFPEMLQYDRCISPDDRMAIRTLYPAAPAFSTISGTVTVLPGGTAIDRAVVVATDASGVPQAAVVTAANGTYSINVPAGNGYSVTAHHNINSTYAPADINFVGASPFITSTTVTNVNATTSIGAINPTVTTGTPTMKLTGSGLNNAGIQTNTLFLPKGSSGSIQLRISGGAVLSPVTNVSLGPDITPGAPTVAGTTISIPFTVSATAAAGVRNVSFTIPSGERLFLPSYHEVLDTGTLTVAAGAGNPGAGIAPFNTLDRPLLGVSLTANAVEDIRIRQLRFNIGGTGPTLPAVRLWIDSGTTVGAVDGSDVRVFSGAAYASSPVAETLAATPGGSVLFDNIALTVRAGQTVNLLLSADIPAAGTGTYIATLDPTSTINLDAHGMFYGDVYTSGGTAPNGTITGTTVTGGTQTLGSLGIIGLQQIRTTALTAIPVGGFTNEVGLQVTLQSNPTSTTTTVGMDVEIQPVGVAFTNIPTASSVLTFTSGTQISINVTVANTVSYHWQARPTSPTLPPGAWVSFGGNADPGDVDFLVDTTTTGVPTVLGQFLADGSTPIALDGSGGGGVVLSATRGTNSGGLTVSLEFEVQPAGTPFTGTPNLTTPFAIGGTAMVNFNGATGTYHWQVRSVGQFGSTSAFVPFDVGPNHFRLDVITANAGCLGRAATGNGDGGMLGSAAGLALLLLSFWSRAARKFTGALVLVFCIGAAALADEESPLPRSLADWAEASPARETEGLSSLTLAEPAPALAPGGSWISFDAYVGMIFMSMGFNTTGLDAINRVVKGIGAGAFGLEALVTLDPAWRVGLAAEIDYWSDIRVLAGGVVGSWRFLSSQALSPAGRPTLEHFAKVGVYYESLTISKANFGSFTGTIGARLGYELRFTLGRNWSLVAGAEAVYSRWKYSPAVQPGGDTSIGGIGGMVTVGIVLIP
jgi:hypothetical protein